MSASMLEHELDCWARGIVRLAGVDEVGRGPLAGPVVAAAVVLDAELATAAALGNGPLAGLNDSKTLTPAQRERYFDALVTLPGVCFGLGRCDHLEIERLNILHASHLAMARALEALSPAAEHALVDGLPVHGLPCPSTAIVGGDGKSLSIAAASVLAKVTRDREMALMDRCHPGYGFAAHKGYGTSAHIQALFERGPCAIHRRAFRPVREAEDLRRRLQGTAAANPEDDGHVVVAP